MLVDFWTYSCINCIRSVPYVRAWYERYRDQGLVVIGVHAPEFAFERDPANVRKAVADLGIGYPVALDNKLTIWRAFNNRYWPAHYLADAQGRIRYHHFGEGRTDETEAAIRALLAEKGAKLGGTRSSRRRAPPRRRLRRDPQSGDYLVTAAPGFRLARGLREGPRYDLPPPSISRRDRRCRGRSSRSAPAASGRGKIAFRFRPAILHLGFAVNRNRPLRVLSTARRPAPPWPGYEPLVLARSSATHHSSVRRTVRTSAVTIISSTRGRSLLFYLRYPSMALQNTRPKLLS